MSYAFLTHRHPEGQMEPVTYFAIPEEKITTLRTSETYSEGRTVGTDITADAIRFETKEAAECASLAASDNSNQIWSFSVGDTIYGDEHSEIFDSVEEALIQGGYTEGSDYCGYFDECEGFDFWDGSNWQTIVTERESGPETFFVLVTDDSLVDALNAAIDEMEFVESSAGSKTYKGGGFVITESFWQGHWEAYSITAE